MARKPKKTDPVPPENVRILYPDGTEVPVECVYEGVEAGIHQWTAVFPEVSVLVPGMQAAIGMLPAKTVVSIAMEERD